MREPASGNRDERSSVLTPLARTTGREGEPDRVGGALHHQVTPIFEVHRRCLAPRFKLELIRAVLGLVACYGREGERLDDARVPGKAHLEARLRQERVVG